jgi:hypothetical protein
MSLTPADVIQAVAEATMILDKRLKMNTSTPDGDDGPTLTPTLSQYILWSTASTLVEKYIGDEDVAALMTQLKLSMDEFESEVDAGLQPSSITLRMIGAGRRTRRTRRR